DAVTKSIFKARKSIDEARVASRDVSDVHDVLDEMTASCNCFWRTSRGAPSQYVFQLDVRRSALASGLAALRKVHPALPKDSPGSTAVRQA
ncbi:hypothetical protein, partial [Arthrobacter rhombi]|uniref:hypothetical protein n=1 Tax=Arthrobacter rhombi TaxID=71253 RepID=UPI003F936C8A